MFPLTGSCAQNVASPFVKHELQDIASMRACCMWYLRPLLTARWFIGVPMLRLSKRGLYRMSRMFYTRESLLGLQAFLS